MPNDKIDPSLHQALAQVFGNQQAQQPSAPNGIASLLSSLFQGNPSAQGAPVPSPSPAQPPVDPYQNFANKATGLPSK